LNHAFTLIELLVVVSIIGILATLVAANLYSARSRARDAERKSDLKNISTALRIYYNDKTIYPATVGFSFGVPFTSGTMTYMEMVPNDPLPGQVYQYTQTNSGDGFTLKACLENSSDSQGVAASGITK
jgi:type II secretion system protein G